MNEDLQVTGANLTSAERTRTYRDQIENERQQRITEHQQAIAIHQRMFAATPGAIQPLNVFADGDSWFDYLCRFPSTPTLSRDFATSARRLLLFSILHTMGTKHATNWASSSGCALSRI